MLSCVPINFEYFLIAIPERDSRSCSSASSTLLSPREVLIKSFQYSAVQAGEPSSHSQDVERHRYHAPAVRNPQPEMSQRCSLPRAPFLASRLTRSQIDWNQVAHDPVLSQEITNGHAARMRYSRFKKQMDGTASVRRPRNPASPNKKKVEKSSKSPRKVKERKPSDGAEVKPEDSYATPETESAGVKREQLASDDASIYASTPFTSQSPTPSSGFAAPPEMDGMMSFGVPGHEHLYPGVMEDPHQAYGLGVQMPMGMGDPFENLWHPQANGEEQVLVKTEPRWEETYRQA